MDAFAVKQACKFAKEHALKNGPLILEMDTYRYHGHSMSDPGSTYRTRDEISGVRQERDPIERIRKLIFAHDLATEKELKDIEKEARKEVDEAIAKAKESPMPDQSELFTNVYRKGLGVELQDLATTMVELWSLMDIPIEEKQPFQNVTCHIAASENEITERNTSLWSPLKLSAGTEVSRLQQMKASKYGPSAQHSSSSLLKRFLEKHKKLRTALLIVVLLGASMVIGDGVLTPAISVLSALSGLQVQGVGIVLKHGEVLLLACVILVGVFALQHTGTHRGAIVFAPIVILWLISIFGIGLYNIICWNLKIVYALSPHYIITFFRLTGKDGWLSIGGVLLSITGTEAMFADLGHFTAFSIKLAFIAVVYPCLVVQYMGQAAYLSKNISSIPNSFYKSIPEAVFWPVFVIATLAAIVGSQAIITATFSIVKQCHALGCFPRVKIVHTSKHMFGQIYIPEINWILMIITLLVAIGFQDTTLVGNAYGLACMTVMFITTFLMALVIIFVWQRNIVFATVFLILFWFIEGIYLSSAIMKVPQGGWVSLLLAFVFMEVSSFRRHDVNRSRSASHNGSRGSHS